ncbi:hypothetical protein [[Eubacterium] hominis]|uniref:hypothetical protein n=1 Tax=[Eubacterium] hominis TaxID=2764325 RepID=UPI003A4DA0A9
MNDNVTFWIVFAVIMVVMIGGTQLYKRHLLKTFMQTLKDRDFDKFFKTADSLPSKYFFPYFNRLYMKMNAYMLMPDQKKVEETFEELLHIRLNKKQNLDVSVKAFYYYIDEEKKGKCKELLDRIKTLGDENALQECQMMYDIFLCEKSNYIDSMEEQLKKAEGWNKGMLCYMLAIQYQNKGDKAKKAEYLKLAEEDLKETPYAGKIEKMIKEN